MKKENIKKVVLAYSGGLDTSIIIPWLKENYNNCEVVAVSGDVGQGTELDGLEEKAKATGASKLYVLDLKKDFVENYIFPTLKFGAKYEDYLLGTSFARPCIAKALADIAIKGAQATAAAIYLARTGHSKADIKAYVEREFGYDLSRTCDEIRPTYHHVESCQETVPQAITAFLESTDFEDALRTAVSLGGDSDTLAAITGSIAEGFYGVPEDLKQECRQRLTPELTEILLAFQNND